MCTYEQLATAFIELRLSRCKRQCCAGACKTHIHKRSNMCTYEQLAAVCLELCTSRCKRRCSCGARIRKVHRYTDTKIHRNMCAHKEEHLQL